MERLLTDVTFYHPRSLEEALLLRAQERGRTRVVAGGTDVMVWQEQGRFALPESYLSVWGIPELVGVLEVGCTLEVGAATPYSTLIQSPPIRHYFPHLVAASELVGAAQIQNRGTLGGNVVNASPAGDTLPVLAVADASFVVQSRARGARTIPYSAFYTGYRTTAMQDDELLVKVILPLPPLEFFGGFGKVGSRQAQTISKVMLALQGHLRPEGSIDRVALSVGSVGPVVGRLPRTEAALCGQFPSAALADDVADILMGEISPIDDVRSSSAYRRFAAVGLLRRLLRQWQNQAATVK
jgi:CO/xanthine dehydrogenase FAD-binding subunit